MEPADELFEDDVTNTRNGIPFFQKLHYCPAKTASGTVVNVSNSPLHQAFLLQIARLSILQSFTAFASYVTSYR